MFRTWPVIITNRLQKLNEAFRLAPVVVFQAPAGCGKTEAAAWWAGQSGKPTIWLPLGEEPDLCQPETLLHVLAGRVCEMTGQPAHGSTLSVSACLHMLRQAFPDGVVLIGDSWHLASSPEMQALTTALGAGCGGGIGLVLTTRTVLDLPALPVWEVSQRALVIGTDDLQFDLADTAAFLGLSPDDALGAQALTQGRLFALVRLRGLLQRGLTADQRHLGENLSAYWLQEVLSGHPTADRDFLGATAVMDHFSIDECEALGLADSDGALRRLTATRLYFSALEPRFRLHDLPRQAILASLGPVELRRRRRHAARALFERNDPSCLPLFLAAGAFPDAARAIAWFFVTSWRELAPEMPVLRHWVAQLPEDFLEGDPAGMMLHVWLHPERSQAILVAVLERCLRAFEASGDRPCRLMALLTLAGKYQMTGDADRWRQVVDAMDLARRDGAIPDPLLPTVLSALIRYQAREGCDLEAMEHYLLAIQELVSVTSGSQAVQFEAQVEVLTAYLHAGEARRAWQAWYRSLALMPDVPGYDLYLLGVDGELRQMADPPHADLPMTTYVRPLQAPAGIEPLLLFDRAEIAWVEHDYAMADELYNLFLDIGPASTSFHDTAFHDACRRLSHMRLRAGDPAGALAACQQATQWHGTVYTRSWLAWHEAAALAELGDYAGAQARLDGVLATAQRYHFTFLWVVARLLHARWHGMAPTPEVRWLLAAWDFALPLERHQPDLQPLSGGRQPRVTVRSLGPCEVHVDGRPVAWKRTNALIILLDLLVHPDGSSAADLQRRYWPLSDAAAVRKDVQALRAALEPDCPGSGSRYVVLEDGGYRLTRDPCLIWWDVTALRHLHLFGRRVDGHLDRDLRHALAVFLPTFAADFGAYAPFAAVQVELAPLQQALNLLVHGGRKEPLAARLRHPQPKL